MKIRPAQIIILLLQVFLALELYYTKLPSTYEKTAQVMGTTVRIKVNGPGEPYLADQAICEIKRLEKLFRPAQLSSYDTIAVLKIAEEVRRASHGAFNVRWRGAAIDLGGIGKGYAVESARQLLLKKGARSAIIDMHSSIAVIGDNWKVGIQDPREKGKIMGVIPLNDGDALSTSGQYEQPRHIIDPRTGKPADQCLGVTVVAKDAGLADALSTAVFVLGPVAGMELVEKFNVRAIIIDKNGTIYDNIGVKLR